MEEKRRSHYFIKQVSTIGRGSRIKGSSFELKIAKQLTAWTNDEEKVHRVPQSGAGGSTTWHTDARMAGDIVFPVESKNPFVIECKKQEVSDLHRQVFFNQADISSWWGQCVGDALRMNAQPLLIFSKNRDKTYAMVPYLDKVWNRMVTNYPITRQITSFDNIRDETQYFDTIMVVLDDLLEVYDYKTLFKIYSTKRARDWNKFNEEEPNE